MADDAAASTEDSQVTFNVKAANDKKHVLTLPSTTTVADLKTKLSSSEYADLPPERQRLIYSGRVLKDHDTLASTKIKDGHTVHLVKGAASNARQNPASQGTGSSTSGSGTPAAQVPTNIAAGTGNNPLAGLTGARYAGFHGLPSMDSFGADGGMSGPPNPDQLLEMMNDPNFLQQMNEAMENPHVLEMMQNSPMVRGNPMVAEILRNPDMRRLMFNPQMMRTQLQMQRAMNRSSGGSSFPMPGATNTTPQNTTGTQNQTSNATSQNPFQADPLANLLSGGFGGGAGANPFASMQNQTSTPSAGTDSNTSATASSAENTQGTQNTSTSPPPATPANPFASLFGTPPAGSGPGAQQANPLADAMRTMSQNPDFMRSVAQMMGGGGAFGQPPSNPSGTTSSSNPQAANPFSALFPGSGFGTPPPQDNRPPEEVYESQLRQLNEMGFYEFERNIAALRRSGGNVQGAIEFLLGGGS